MPDLRRSVADLFDRSARTYDAVGVAFFATVARRLLDDVGLAAGERVLDVDCGRGAVLFPAAERVGAEGSVHGIDLSPEMIERTGRDSPAGRPRRPPGPGSPGRRSVGPTIPSRHGPSPTGPGSARSSASGRSRRAQLGGMPAGEASAMIWSGSIPGTDAGITPIPAASSATSGSTNPPRWQ